MTKKDRRVRLKHLLVEAALRHQLSSDSAPSTSMQNALASIREAMVPKRDSAPRQPRHQHSLAPKTRHGSHSLVLRKLDRRCSLTVKPAGKGETQVCPTLGHLAPSPGPAPLTWPHKGIRRVWCHWTHSVRKAAFSFDPGHL